MSARIDAVQRIVDEGREADDVLRAVVGSIIEAEDVRWAGIAFTEDAALRLGPARGEPDEERRVRFPIAYEGAAVGELWVDGDVSRREFETIATLIAPYVLIGWDTDGEAWEP